MYVLAVKLPERLIALLVDIMCSAIEFAVSSNSNTSVSSVHKHK